MHDIDRTQAEFDPEADGLEVDSFELRDESGYGEVGGASPFSEVEEMELASALLEVTSDAEMDQFLGSLFKKAVRGIGRFTRSPFGRALGGILKGVAKTVLPQLGSQLGTAAGGALAAVPYAGPVLGAIGPSVGGMVGSQLGTSAAQMFGAEFEGMTPEDQEFEIARRLVRLAGAAATKLGNTPLNAVGQTAVKMAQQAAADAIRTHAPGFFPAVRAVQQGVQGLVRGKGGSGRWVRRGQTIVLFGA